MIIKTDSGATYEVRNVGMEHVAIGQRTGTTYRSALTWVEITGHVSRNHGTLGGAFPSSIGRGRRCVLHLDTGEGISRIPGVVLD